MAPEYASLEAQGLKVAKIVNYYYDAVIIKVPREKALALSFLKDAIRRVAHLGPIIVDGQKTDGIESLLKLCRERFDVQEVISRAHGKLFWMRKRDLEVDIMNSLDFPEPTPKLMSFGFHTAPGVFSADGPDKGSEFLASVLPVLEGRVADLGSGWGYLAHKILANASPEVLHLVEADWLAVLCAKENVSHDAAEFHWADATKWTPPEPVDHVVTNPPFHTSRKADPELGRAFIRSAAGMLKPKGNLWLVANRHLPYEKTLEDTFHTVETLGSNPSFKIFHATSPKRSRKG